MANLVMYKKLLNTADRSAIILSSLCLIHCLVLPVILVLLPTLTSVAFFSDERFHTWLLYGVIPISLFAVVLGYFHHRNRSVVLVTSIGMSVLILVALLGHDVFGEQGEIVASVLGSILVAYGHIRNFKTRKQLRQCH
ncbi:MerC domain-containing protein [Paraglaciecola aquimarina]|uniref:MerC domain-containing protein n=1 Tax=Paraglaciecola aquimarina TaxID=1235557 RepID=A0ABU3SUQ5_9ALTE|nr:MerC domain-containing protein [Paraglaciecola aquimarina]MDU0353734.1 MerC domain-containing protein [Paraglaciecola aquimarina]